MNSNHPNQFVISERCIARILIIVGALTLFSLFFGGLLLNLMWPLFIVVPGLPFLYFAMIAKGKTIDHAYMAIPGSLISGTGAILFMQNLTDHWESWAYAWTLYFVLLGVAFVFAGTRAGEDDLPEVGRYFIIFGSIGFIGLGLFFELFIFDTLGFLGKAMLAGLMLVLGWWLLNREKLVEQDKPKRKNTLEDFQGNIADFQQVSDHVRQRVTTNSEGEIIRVEKQPK